MEEKLSKKIEQVIDEHEKTFSVTGTLKTFFTAFIIVILLILLFFFVVFVTIAKGQNKMKKPNIISSLFQKIFAKKRKEIKRQVINEMLKMEIQIAQDSLDNNWTKEKESRIFKERIYKNKIIQSLRKNFTKEELLSELLPKVKEKLKNIYVKRKKK